MILTTTPPLTVAQILVRDGYPNEFIAVGSHYGVGFSNTPVVNKYKTLDTITGGAAVLTAAPGSGPALNCEIITIASNGVITKTITTIGAPQLTHKFPIGILRGEAGIHPDTGTDHESEDRTMRVIKLSEAETRYLRDLLANTGTREIRVAVDDIDDAFKIKVGGGVWSPPLGRVEA
jgi:hypothetical protein